MTSLVLFLFAIAIGKSSTHNLAAAEYRDCQERNVIVDQENQQSQGMVAVLTQARESLKNTPFPIPQAQRDDAISRYDALIRASGAKPHFDCRVYRE